jgi:hypothetical protein
MTIRAKRLAVDFDVEEGGELLPAVVLSAANA